MTELSFRRTYRETTYKATTKKSKSSQLAVHQFGPQLANDSLAEAETDTLSENLHRTKYQFSQRLLHIQLRIQMCSPQNCNKCMKMIHLVSSPIKAVRNSNLEFNIFRSLNRNFRWAAGITIFHIQGRLCEMIFEMKNCCDNILLEHSIV